MFAKGSPFLLVLIQLLVTDGSKVSVFPIYAFPANVVHRLLTYAYFL